MEAIEKYDNGEEETENVFEDSLSTLVFELNQLVHNNTIGNGLYTTMCFGFVKEGENFLGDFKIFLMLYLWKDYMRFVNKRYMKQCMISWTCLPS